MVKKRRAAWLIFFRICFLGALLSFVLKMLSLAFLTLGLWLFMALCYFLSLIMLSEISVSGTTVITVKKGWIFKRSYRFKKEDIRAISVYKTPLSAIFGLSTVRYHLKGFSVTVPFMGEKMI